MFRQTVLIFGIEDEFCVLDTPHMFFSYVVVFFVKAAQFISANAFEQVAVAEEIQHISSFSLLFINSASSASSVCLDLT